MEKKPTALVGDVFPDRLVGNATTPLPLLTSTTNRITRKADVILRLHPWYSATNRIIRKRRPYVSPPTCTPLPPPPSRQCRGRVTPLPSLFNISTSIPNSASRERMLSGPRCLPARRNKTMEPRDDQAGYSDCIPPISVASLAPFMIHHSCIRPNGSTRRGKH